MRAWGGIAIAPALLMAVVASAAAAPEPALEYRGTVLTSRQVETLVEEALRAPPDSSALERSLERMVAELQNRGYLDARIDGAWEAGTPPRLTVIAREGARYRLKEVRLQVPAGEDSAAFTRSLGLEPGAWASPAGVGQAIDRAVRASVAHGHPYASLGVSRWDADSSVVSLELSGTQGPRVTISRVRFEGLKATQPRWLERALGKVVGLPYSPAAAEAGRERLIQLGLFRSVTLEGIEGEGDWSRGQLVYRVEEPRYNRLEGAVGAQGEAGTAGLVRLDLGNLLGTGRALGLHWESRGRGLAQLGGRYVEPLVLGAPLKIEAVFDQQLQDTFYVRTQWGARAHYWLSTEDQLEAGFEEERVVQERQEVEQAQIQTTVFALERSTLDEAIGARRGWRVRIEAEQSFKTEHLRPTGKRTARASAAALLGAWNRPLGARNGLALELRAAGRFSSQRVLPLFERYPLGGASSLRGYDEEEFRVDRYALARLEWRWFLGGSRQWAFLFWDHARAGTRLPVASGGDRFEALDRDGIGFGLRLDTAGGLVGIDYGLEPGRPPLEGKIHLQLVSTF